MKAVRAGEDVILTDRGKPVAVIQAVPEVSPADRVIRRLEVAGILRPAGKKTPLASWRPRPLRGGPLSGTLREERDAS